MSVVSLKSLFYCVLNTGSLQMHKRMPQSILHVGRGSNATNQRHSILWSEFRRAFSFVLISVETCKPFLSIQFYQSNIFASAIQFFYSFRKVRPFVVIVSEICELFWMQKLKRKRTKKMCAYVFLLQLLALALK